MPLQPPPRDASGRVIPHDHSEIASVDGVIRRISQQQIIVDKSGQRRISSLAFKPSSGVNAGMSVDLERLITQAGLEARAFVTTPRWTGSVRWTAETLRGENFLVGYSPQPDNEFHGEVWAALRRHNDEGSRHFASGLCRLKVC